MGGEQIGVNSTNDFVYGHRGIIYKQQYNARIYQPIGNNGDFISLAIHYNQNRNNFGGSLPLRQDLIQCVSGHLDNVEAQRRNGLRFDAAISRGNGGLLRRGQTGGELDDQ